MIRKTSLLALAFSIAFATSSPAADGDAANRILYVLTWDGYFLAEKVEEFEKEFDCIVEIEYYDSSDTLYEKVKNGAHGYDLLVAASDVTFALNQAGMLRELDHGKIPNLKHITSRAIALFPDPEMIHHIPYVLAISGVAYRRSEVPQAALGSWRVYGTRGMAKNAAMSNEMRYVMGAALKYLDHSANTTSAAEIAEAAGVLADWKRNVALFALEEAEKLLAEGGLSVVQTFNGRALQLMRQDPEIDFFVPEEGSIVRADGFVVPADAENPDLAHAFINLMVEPAAAAATMREKCFYMPVPAGRELVPADLGAHPAFKVREEIFLKSERIAGVGEALALYDEAWLSVLLGRSANPVSAEGAQGR